MDAARRSPRGALTVGTMPHEQVMRAIELPGTVGAPAALRAPEV